MSEFGYIQKMQSKYKALSLFIDLYEFIFLFNKDKNPRYALAKKIGDGNLQILDVCFGTGNGSRAVWETNNTTVGIDLSFDMLSAAKKKILRQNKQNVFALQMDAANMGFQDEEFDVVTVSFGLHDMEYDLMLRVLKEMYRVLKEGGTLYILDYQKEGMLLKQLVFSVYLKISYPQHVQEFLRYDWNDILSDVGFRFGSVETYTVSQLVSATK